MAKTKYISLVCPYCHRLAKMEIIGVASENKTENSDQKSWLRCARCKHSVLISLIEIDKAKKATAAAISRDNCVLYSGDKIYAVGQEIYHTEWDDVGRVIRKDKSSGGLQTIVVSFEKLGERKLVENLPADIEHTEENPVQQV